MIADLGDAPADAAYDVVIVGGGAAGITMTLELLGSGLRVALLEGGGLVQTQESQARYAGPLTVDRGLTYPPLDAYRLRMLGGTTNHWSGWCRPLEPEVFAPRPGGFDIGWPFPRAEIEPYLARAAELCQLGRPEWDTTTLCTDAGMTTPFGDGGPDEMLRPVAWRFSPPTRFAVAYLEQLAGEGIDVFHGANLVDLELAGRLVAGVRLIDERGNTHRFTADRVVLACGAIENARQLLSLAERVPAVGSSSVLGAGFMEHPHLSVGQLLCDPALLAPDGALHAMVDIRLDPQGGAFMAGAALCGDRAATLGSANVSFTLTDATAHQPDRQHIEALRTLHRDADGSGPAVLAVFARSEQRWNPVSRVTLSEQRDDLGQRRAAVTWVVHDRDLDDVHRARQLFGDALARRRMVSSAAFDEPPALADGGGHQMGGTRMHESPRHGVVDHTGRVHALDNLYVAGSSVFPTTCFSNPTLTIVALAVRLAGWLRSGR